VRAPLSPSNMTNVGIVLPLFSIKAFPVDWRTIVVAGRSLAVDRYSLLGAVPKKRYHSNGERLYLMTSARSPDDVYGTNILWRIRPQSITPSGCPPQRCAAEQPCQEYASPGRFPFLYPPTSLSHQGMHINSKLLAHLPTNSNIECGHRPSWDGAGGSVCQTRGPCTLKNVSGLVYWSGSHECLARCVTSVELFHAEILF